LIKNRTFGRGKKFIHQIPSILPCKERIICELAAFSWVDPEHAFENNN
jgi:hypothetical protein